MIYYYRQITERGTVMPRVYQPVKDNLYQLEKCLYQQIVWTIKGYPFTKEEYEDNIISISSPEESVIVNERRAKEINAIEQGLYAIPKPLREGVFNHIVYGKPYDMEVWARKSSWNKYAAKYVYAVAQLLDKAA
jgi:hypothetical protein